MLEIIGFFIVLIFGCYMIFFSLWQLRFTVLIAGWSWQCLWLLLPFGIGVYIIYYSLTNSPFSIILN